MREEGRGFKRVHNQMGEARPLKSAERSHLAYIHMLAFSPFLLALGRSCPSSVHPHFMYVHAKIKTRNQQKSNGKKEMCRAYERGIK